MSMVRKVKSNYLLHRLDARKQRKESIVQIEGLGVNAGIKSVHLA